MSHVLPAEITYTQVLAMVKQMLRVDSTTENDIYLLSLIEWAASSLNTTERLKMKNCTATVENNRFKLPDDAKQLVAFRAQNSCYTGIFIDVAFFNQCGCTTRGFGNLVGAVKQNGRFMYLLNTVDDGIVIEIAYTVVNRNPDGTAVLNEECEIAVANYAAYTFANSFPEVYPETSIRRWEKVWSLQSGRCRGNAARRTFMNQRNQIRSKFNAILSTEDPFNYLSSVFGQFYYTNNPGGT